MALIQETEDLVMVADLLNILSNRAINLSNSSARTLVPIAKGSFCHTSCGLPCVMARCANSLLYHVDATTLRDTPTPNVQTNIKDHLIDSGAILDSTATCQLVRLSG